MMARYPVEYFRQFLEVLIQRYEIYHTRRPRRIRDDNEKPYGLAEKIREYEATMERFRKREQNENRR